MLFLIKIIIFIIAISTFSSASPLQLAKIYNNVDINITNWFISEKLDGVRAYWSGKELISRNGKNFNPPSFFIKNFPNFELDGELWTKRGDFENIISFVNSDNLESKERWKYLTYNIFEVPNSEGNFTKRVSRIRDYLKVNSSKYIKITPQISCKNPTHLKTIFENLVSDGAEGVMIKNPFVNYEIGRSENLLKLKPYFDAEAKVIAYKEGKGKYKNMLGSILVEFNNKRFYIGSGFSDKERKNPPKIGSIVTFKYNGFTKNDIPRFPVFLRVKF